MIGEPAVYKLDDFKFDALLEEKFVKVDVELGGYLVGASVDSNFDQLSGV